MSTSWRYYYRRYLGWLPIQFCMICGRWYWGGSPQFGIRGLDVFVQWMPWWSDYCSRKCADEDLERLV